MFFYPPQNKITAQAKAQAVSIDTISRYRAVTKEAQAFLWKFRTFIIAIMVSALLSSVKFAFMVALFFFPVKGEYGCQYTPQMGG
jgi:hypothetical protein